MFNPVANPLRFLRATWRWARGHCPLCNRNLHAGFPADAAGNPGCRACKDETHAAVRMGLWGGLAEFPAEVAALSAPEAPPREAGS